MVKQYSYLTSLMVIFITAVSLQADIPRTMYVVNESAETISKMEMETFDIEQNVLSTGQYPNQIAVHNEMLYIVNSGTDDIIVVDPKNDGEVVKTIALPEGSNPWAIGFVGANKAYVTGAIANKVYILDLENGIVTKDIDVGIYPEGILVKDNKAFIANTGFVSFGVFGQATVSIIDVLTDSVTHTVDVPTNAQDMAVDPMGRIHVICTGDYATVSGQVAVIDLYTGSMWDTPAVVDTVELGWIKQDVTTFAAGDIAITSGGKGYCVAWGDGENGFLCSYDAKKDTVLRSAADPILIGPNVSNLVYDSKEDVMWIPYMSMWGGDGFVQKFDVTLDSVVWKSDVLGNGTKSLCILEPVMESDPWADAVVSFTPGTGNGFGSNYFPNNVLGAPDPDPSISEYNGSSNPQEILSLGHGGEIVLEFTDNYIYDGEGIDFTIFENVFLAYPTYEPFIEAGIVAVSQNGVDFVEFPYDTAMWAGLAGVAPTKDNQNPTDPTVSGGDQFDLADVGLDYVTFVKITDLGDIKQEGRWNGDFDLDAVVAVNSREGVPTAIENNTVTSPVAFSLDQNYPNPFNPETTIRFSLKEAKPTQLTVYNSLGQVVNVLLDQQMNGGSHQVFWNGRDVAGNAVTSGIYMYKLKSGDLEQTRKMMLVR